MSSYKKALVPLINCSSTSVAIRLKKNANGKQKPNIADELIFLDAFQLPIVAANWSGPGPFLIELDRAGHTSLNQVTAFTVKPASTRVNVINSMTIGAIFLQSIIIIHIQLIYFNL